ncbi:MAG: hypothetical protein ACRD59_09160 [Candidatus Acidiferrales bacterium]
MAHEYTVQFKYEHRSTGSTGRTIRVEGSSIQVAIAKATREFVKSLDRKEKFDAQKGLHITAARAESSEAASAAAAGSSASPNRGIEEAD